MPDDDEMPDFAVVGDDAPADARAPVDPPPSPPDDEVPEEEEE